MFTAHANRSGREQKRHCWEIRYRKDIILFLLYRHA
jgi:hypothetical protein